MEEKRKPNKRIPLFLSIVIVFCVLGGIVFYVSRKITREMSAAAIQNLNENLELIKCTIESVYKKDAEFQRMIAQELAVQGSLEDFVRSYQKNGLMLGPQSQDKPKAPKRRSPGRLVGRQALVRSARSFRLQ